MIEDETFSDLDPMPQYDGPNPVVSITYSEEFIRKMNIFRAVVHKGEFSTRALNLTTELLEFNPANYTVWQYRRNCLRALSADLSQEIEYMDNFAEDNPKNYQIWYHRRAVVEMLGDGSREMEFTSKVFDVDCKNYHAWAHRQWALTCFNFWEGELEFINILLEDDLRNNSAWNQRWFYVHKNTLTPLSDQVLLSEVDFTVSTILKLRLNESAWNYLRGLQNYHPFLREKIMSIVQQQVDLDPSNPLALALLADMREEENISASFEIVDSLLTQLIKIDAMREKYWTRRLLEFRLKNESESNLEPCDSQGDSRNDGENLATSFSETASLLGSERS